MTGYGVVLFFTNSSVMRAEKLLKKAGYSIKIIPTPREFSSDCGVALCFDWANCEQVKVILDTAHLEIDGIHQM
jgi:Putative Se/S carrier protein-like